MAKITQEELLQHLDPEKQALENEIKNLRDLIAGTRKEGGKLELLFNRVMSAITPIDPLTPVKFERKSSAPVEAVLHVTDWHIGGHQDADEIEGFNAFNQIIATRRVLALAEKFINWVHLHRNGYNITRARVIATGDMISGDIHEELRITNEYPSPVQVVRASELLASLIALIAQHFDQVTVDFLTADNHGRLTKKPQAKDEGFNSFTYLVGEMTRQRLVMHTPVTFNLHTLHEVVVLVNNLQYLISHGHNVTGWMGLPWYSIERKVAKEAKARMQVIMGDIERAKTVGFNKYLFGHWHTPFNTTWYACGGSLSGTDAYDHRFGRHEDPCQVAWLVHEKHGEFDRINFRLA